MAKIASQSITFTVSKLVKGNDGPTPLNSVDQDVKDAIIELLEQTLGSEYIVEEV